MVETIFDTANAKVRNLTFFPIFYYMLCNLTFAIVALHELFFLAFAACNILGLKRTVLYPRSGT